MEDKKYTVYAFINKINEYRYIGITSMTLKNRVYAHLYESRNADNHSAFKEALRCYGINNFNIVILENGISIEEAKDKEKYYIQKYKTYIGFNDCKGYNSSIGGEGAHIVEDEQLRINQYDLNGKFIKSYRSLREAEAITGITRVTIAEVCNGKAITSGGYQWKRFIDVGYQDITPVKAGRDNVIRPVDQFDLDGKWIRTFESLQDAANKLGIYSSTIVKVCNGKLKQTAGFMWRYHNNTDITDIEPYNKAGTKKRRVFQLLNNKVIAEYDSIAEASDNTGYSMQSISASINNGGYAHGFRWVTDSEYKHERGVIQLSLDGEYIAEFKSAMQASKLTGINRASIYNCCIGKNKTAGGYKWIYKQS